jgi:hypothetical protein
MSYIGEIAFIDPPARATVWNDELKIKLTGDATTSWLYAKDELSLRAPVFEVTEVVSAAISTSLAAVVSPGQRATVAISLTLDVVEETNEAHRHFVMMGTYSSRAYVLMVRPRTEDFVFERVGAGWIPGDMLQTAAVLGKDCVIL